ncbi:MAG TPA: DNA polymerase III subunit beta [Thermoanaerobaculia bacterium]|nr:DNA polymerase III subunit beta [Thermoanaerobaculia bacterium]
MQIRLERARLVSELMPMQGIVERRTTIPVLSHILLSASVGRLQLAATDLDVSLTSSCEAQVNGEGAIAIQARKFSEIIRSLVDDQVSLDLVDDRQLKIRSGRSQFRIHGLAPEDFPTLPKVGDEGAVDLEFSQLRSMIAKILFAVSTEESRFQLNGALLKLKAKGMEIVATDGHRLALIENGLEEGREDDGVLVPRKALQELQRFEGDGKLRFVRGEHHLSFRLQERELTCRILEGTFPDYERVIARDNDKKPIFDRKTLADAVQRVALLTGERARAVRLDVAPGQTVISATNPDLGEAHEEVPCEYGGEEIKLGLNPDYLVQFLAAVETEKVRLELKDENTQCVGFPVSGKDERYLCVIMPMRV